KDSSYTYLGGVVGYSENTKFYNNTVNSVLYLNHAETEYVTTLAAGGIAGYVTGNGTYLINSVVDGSITGGVNSKLGAFAGSNSSLASQMPNPDTLQVKGLVSVITNQIEGFGENNFYTKDTHYKLAQKKVDYQKIDIYNSTDFWNVSYGWNTDSVWQEGTKAFTTGETDNRYLVILQCFESFIIYTDDNSNSHSLTSFPDENILTLDIVANDASLLSQEDNSAEIHYGESFKIKATFNDIMNGEEKVTNQDGENIKYDVFFDVVSLRLENKKISNVEFDEETLTWTIPFMKYSYKGTYAVELVKKTYNLYATTVTQDGDLQGKITGSRNSSYTYEELAYEFSYGTSITFYSVAERYFASAGFDFYPSKDRENASGKEMDIEKPKHITLDTCNESMFTFTFTENDVFTLEYLFKNADFSNQGVTVGYVNSVFSNNVCELYFEFELDGEIVDDMFGMRIYVAGEQLSKTNGVLVKKVIKGSDVTISLAGFPDEEYEFVTIADDFGNEYLIDGETTFEFNSSDLETVVFTLQLKSLQDNKGNGQIWWIIGGVAGGIAAIAICWILIVKFRDNSYRNMYNKF
ncbi:MAG: hypothetical protein IKA31_02905, partial [Clostridia bacterium]|nr:hypothetical protein [Clostridia bacterium]